jgi:uncharacterized membrane protein YhhN
MVRSGSWVMHLSMRMGCDNLAVGGPGAALTAFAVLAAVDWVAVARRWKNLEYVAKPGALAAVLAFAATGDDPSAWLLAALALSLAGDVFLMLPADLFVPGLASFLAAHLAYLGAIEASAPARLAGVAVVAVVAVPLAVRIVRAVDEAALRPPVVAYVAAISLMVGSGLGSGDVAVAAGAVSFMASDALIAWNRFVRPLTWAPVTIMVTYHLAQLGLAGGLRNG